ncbi:MAG: hypothetical protein VZR53_07825 [Prevotella sp.]|nr:hypothetical protein [Prevotella sp.]
MYITKVFKDGKSTPIVQHYREGQRLTKMQVCNEGLENHAFVRQTGKETWKVLRNFDHSYESKEVSALSQLAEYLNSQDAPEVVHIRDNGAAIEVLVKVREARKVSDIC